MKIAEHIKNAERSKTPTFSYEIVPPPRGRTIQDIIDAVETIKPFQPAWIDVTSHASNAYFTERPDGTIQKKILRKRPGTLGICGVIQNRFKIDTVAHVLCKGFTKEETEDALIELNFLGIHNILALQGDSTNYTKEKLKIEASNEYASDLVQQVKDLNAGKFLDEINHNSSFDFCIGVAGYPEKHFEAANLKTDIEYLKKKVELGAEYIVTQMFFDNTKFHKFVEHCRDAGITVPIIPGLKVLKSLGQLKTLPKNFYIDIPMELADEVSKNPQHAAAIGIKWAKMQVQDLINAGHQNVHFYVMNDTSHVVDVVKGYR
jgi:methylenetetrahydrofolate reductase (NADPH)